MDATEILGLVAGLGTSISSLPQLVKLVKEKKAENVSKSMFYVLIVGVLLWIVYGSLKSDIPIITTNILSLLINIATAILQYKYRHNS
jgi:MtN3 and saliva related transmembrane protein